MAVSPLHAAWAGSETVNWVAEPPERSGVVVPGSAMVAMPLTVAADAGVAVTTTRVARTASAARTSVTAPRPRRAPAAPRADGVASVGSEAGGRLASMFCSFCADGAGGSAGTDKGVDGPQLPLLLPRASIGRSAGGSRAPDQVRGSLLHNS